MIPLTAPQGMLLHTALESLAYLAAGRYFIILRRRTPGPLSSSEDALWICAAAIVGAALGSKVVFWLQYPEYVFANRHQIAIVLGGKSIVGGLLGGLAGVELAKLALRVKLSTGDLFVFPLILGIMIGRLGCLFAGINDNTYGNPTDLPWAITYGDGVSRHPVALYEILFLGLMWIIIAKLKPRLTQAGDAFRIFMVGYFAFRFAIDFMKPPHYPLRSALEQAIPAAHLYFGLFTAIQLACLGALGYYAAGLLRATRELSWQK